MLDFRLWILDCGFWLRGWSLGSGIGFQADPPRPPVGRVEQAHRPPGGFAPGRRSTLAVPHLHLPEDLLAGPQRTTAIGHVELLVRLDAPAVPDVPAVARQAVERRRHEDLPRAVAQALAFPAELPGETRRRGVDAERVHHAVAPQLSGSQRAPAFGRSERDQSDEHGAEQAGDHQTIVGEPVSLFVRPGSGATCRGRRRSCA